MGQGKGALSIRITVGAGFSLDKDNAVLAPKTPAPTTI